MNASLQNICELFVENQEMIKKTLKMGNAYVYPVCANLFCAKGVKADAEKLLASRQLLKEKTGVFSSFRGNIQLPLICMLALEENPEEKLEKALANYKLMKKEFMASDFLALAAVLMADEQNVEEKIARGKALYRLMQKEHPFLTSTEDSVFALMMALSERDDEALVADMEENYDLLRQRFGAGNELQTVSHVLALAEGDARQKAERFLEMYDAIGQFGGKYGRYYELAVLAALSVLEGDVRLMAADVMDADAFLSTQKGYGFFGMGKKMRLMHAAMIVSNDYTSRGVMNAAAMSSTLSILIAQSMAALAAISAASAASAASN